MTFRTAQIAFGLIAIATAGAAKAGDMVKLDSSIFVEKRGAEARVLQRARMLSPGDRVVTVLSWQRQGEHGGFTVTNPLPAHLSYQGSASPDEEVSVDGGKTWGKLGALRIHGHAATPEDVTHVRWRIASGGDTGRIAYSAIVR